jgi:hypothetical protein
MMIWLTLLPHAWREVASARRPARITVDGDRAVLEHPALFHEPVQLTPADLHSIVPHQVRPPTAGSWLRRLASWLQPTTIRPSQRTPAVGDLSRRGDSLLFVFRAARLLPQARGQWSWINQPPRPGVPLRGLIVAVDDLDAAQRAVQPWGLLARLTPDAFEWLRPRGTTTAPGPDPVYGT